MLMLDNLDAPGRFDPVASARAALMKALDMGGLWQACAELVTRQLPCHSCSLMFDIDDYEPQQARHFLAEATDAALPVTSLAVSAPYLAANPRVRWYTFSQIMSQDALAAARLQAQNPGPGWREFIHLAFWNEQRLEAVLSIRIRANRPQLTKQELAFLTELYPTLEAGLQRVRSLHAERIRHQAFEAMLYRLPLATALIDARLTPLYLSAEAKKLCLRWSRGLSHGKRLPEAIERGIHHSMVADPQLWSSADGRHERRLRLHDPERGLHMQVEISPPLELATRRPHYLLTFAEDAGGDALDGGSPGNLLLLQRLSPSERRVATLVARGLRNDDVAHQLCRSRKTVESQISSIYRKLDVANRAQLVRLLAG